MIIQEVQIFKFGMVMCGQRDLEPFDLFLFENKCFSNRYHIPELLRH